MQNIDPDLLKNGLAKIITSDNWRRLVRATIDLVSPRAPLIGIKRLVLIKYLSDLISINFSLTDMKDDPATDSKIKEVVRQKFKDNTRKEEKARNVCKSKIKENNVR